ncbi:MAG: U32 family peptidase [Anaerovoracaceae bacterium]
MKKKSELLIPAGGISQFIAAVENGADAVYIGGKFFNARINADNFDDIEIEEAIDFAHIRGVKVYVTMNTLISDREMERAFEYVKFLYEIGVDALIVQDLGLAKVIKDIMPDFHLHLSTQGSVYNLEGVKAAKSLGFNRVVLARELSLEEIKAIIDEADTEIEVFVHGAMCVCYSGQCQMSRYFGGRSGNRGKCAQPCRLPYKTLDENNKLIDTFMYPLSPKDLCLIDHIGEMVEIGVKSLKIEGRMKSPEYVAIVTSIYRKYLDEYYQKGWYKVTDEDRKQLEQIFNRGGFTEGYYYENQDDNMMAGDIPKHRGVKIGKVVKKVQGTTMIDVKLYDELAIGDGVEIQGKKVFGNIVTYILPLKGGLTRIGDLRGMPEHGDVLYKISSKEQLKRARSTYENVTFESGKYIRKSPVALNFIASKGSPIQLKVSTLGNIENSQYHIEIKREDIIPEKAEKTPTSKEQIEKQLKKTGNTPFVAESVSIEMEDGIQIPISAINDIRRQGLEAIEKTIIDNSKRTIKGKIRKPDQEEPTDTLELFFYEIKDFYDFDWEQVEGIDVVALLPVVSFIREYETIPKTHSVRPYITNISKGVEDEFIQNNFMEIVEKSRECGISVGNICWVKPFADNGVRVFGDYGLNIFNNYARDAYRKLGMEEFTLSLETIEENQGNYPLMVSEHIADGKYIIGKKGDKIRLRKTESGDKIILTGEKEPIQVKNIIANSPQITRIFITEGSI